MEPSRDPDVVYSQHPAISIMDSAPNPEDTKSQFKKFQEEDEVWSRKYASDSSSADSSVWSEYGRYRNTAQVDPDIATSHKNNEELKGIDAVNRFFRQIRDVQNVPLYEWIRSLQRSIAGEAVPLFTDNDTGTDYQLHFSYTWLSALYTGRIGPRDDDDFVHGLLHITNNDDCEIIHNPAFWIPLGKLFVNKSGCSNWTGYEIFATGMLELWIIYAIDEVNPESSYPVESSLSTYTFSENGKDRQTQTKIWPSFKIARLWKQLRTLASATFEKAMEEVRISHCKKFMGSFYLLQLWQLDAKWAMEVASWPIDFRLETQKLEVQAESVAGRELLLLAYKNDDKAIMHLQLTTKHPNQDQPGKSDNLVLLLLAAKAGDETIVHLLLATGTAKVESKDESHRTPLSWAAGNGHKTVVKLLLDAEADIDSEDETGRTPLSWAAGNGHKTVVKLLLHTKANLESKDELPVLERHDSFVGS